MMTSDLYNLLSSKTSFVAWYPFCESPHTSGFTPNVANQLDGSGLRLTLNSFGTGEYCGSGLVRFINNVGTGWMTSTTTASGLQIISSLTIIINHKTIDTDTSDLTLLTMWANGETTATNAPYFIYKRSTEYLGLLHEYGSGSNVDVSSGVKLLNNGSGQFIVVRRDNSLKQYQTKIDNSGFINVSYSDNPTGGTSTYLNIPGNDPGWYQLDGEYRNIMIFNEVLTDAEIQIIKDAGNPDASWFDYSNWNGSVGYVTWINPAEENKFYGVVVNQRLSPYKAGTSDKIQLKYNLYSDDKTRLSYIKNAALELKLNTNSGLFQVVNSGTTDNYGTHTFYHSCSGISGINNCLGYVTTTINDKIYDSNIVRFNFA